MYCGSEFAFCCELFSLRVAGSGALGFVAAGPARKGDNVVLLRSLLGSSPHRLLCLPKAPRGTLAHAVPSVPRTAP
eukprot:4421197-Amphidinium_carterae.1